MIKTRGKEKCYRSSLFTDAEISWVNGMKYLTVIRNGMQIQSFHLSLSVYSALRNRKYPGRLNFYKLIDISNC